MSLMPGFLAAFRAQGAIGDFAAAAGQHRDLETELADHARYLLHSIR